MRRHRGSLLLLPIFLASLASDQSFAVSPQIDPTYRSDDLPEPIGDRVNPPTDSVDFYYLSDVEDPTLQAQTTSQPLVTSGTSSSAHAKRSLPWIVTWVRNIHPAPLRFAWNAYNMYRPSDRHPLQAGRPDKYTFRVCDYYVDTNTQIKFTHVGRPLTAPSYQASTTSGLPECQAETNSSISSFIETGYFNDDKALQSIDLKVTSTFDGYDVIFEIDYNRDDISFALSGFESPFASSGQLDTSDPLLQEIKDQLESSGVPADMVTLADLLEQDDTEDLPANLIEAGFLQVSLANAEDPGPIRFAIPTKEFTTVAHSLEKIAVFDGDGNLISIGPVGLYMPKN
jgi:hypothetical protein